MRENFLSNAYIKKLENEEIQEAFKEVKRKGGIREGEAERGKDERETHRDDRSEQRECGQK